MTFVYVTHDQEEALTMSDRVAVFNHGRIEQIGHAGRGLRAARDRVRRRLRRHLEHRRARRPAPRASARSGSRSRRRSGEPATVDDVVFVGAFTRYLVDDRPGRAARRRPAEPTVPSARARHARSTSPGATRTHSSFRRTRPIDRRSHDEQAHVGAARSCSAVGARASRPQASTEDARGGHAEHDRVGGLHAAAVGEAVREADRLQGQREVRRLLGRDGHADALRAAAASTTWSRPPATRACA